MPKKHIVNCATGEQSYVEMTDEEVAAQQAMAAGARAMQCSQIWLATQSPIHTQPGPTARKAPAKATN